MFSLSFQNRRINFQNSPQFSIYWSMFDLQENIYGLDMIEKTNKKNRNRFNFIRNCYYYQCLFFKQILLLVISGTQNDKSYKLNKVFQSKRSQTLKTGVPLNGNLYYCRNRVIYCKTFGARALDSHSQSTRKFK